MSRFIHSKPLLFVVAIFAVFAVLMIPSLSSLGWSHESVGEKIESSVDEARKDTRKASRKMRRKARNATGRGSVVKDARDGLNDAGDEVETAARKAKRKVD